MNAKPGVSDQGPVRGYDVIGDIHGCYRSLCSLLERLGYSRSGGVYRHPQRQAVFLGDVIDRGPAIRESLCLVREMAEAGSARVVMGNHEYNALLYTTPAPPELGRAWLRDHNERHRRIIQETLDQFDGFAEDWRSFLDWFRTLPLFLEFSGFRVVHACWDQNLISQYLQRYGTAHLDDELLVKAARQGSFEWTVMDRLLRGTSLQLPEGMTITGLDGFVRRFFRTSFWSEHPVFYHDVVFQPDPLPLAVAHRRLDARERSRLLHYGPEDPPVFVGHYWLRGIPKAIRPNIACLDYSAVKGGRLVAYRLDGESTLDNHKFVWIDAREAHEKSF